MSRHELDAPGVRLTIGWDAPLATCFLTVWIDALPGVDEDEQPQLWIGASYGEAPDATHVVAVARRHGPAIAADFDRQLLADRMRDPARLPATGGATLERILHTLAGEPPVQPTQH